MTLHILHTNDFHGKLTDAGAARLRAAVADLGTAPYLLLDAGDAVRAGNVEVNPFGEPILGLMSDTGYHAMTMGNREFHVLHAALQTKINRARFPVLCANVYPKDDRADEPLPIQPFASFVRNGVRVAVIGLTVPMVTAKMGARFVSNFLFSDPVAVARQVVADLRPTHDFVIALTHIGLREDERLAQSVGGIDCIVGGHTHAVLETAHIVNGIPIVQGGSHGRYLGHMVLERADDGQVSASATLAPLEGRKPR